MNIIPKRQAMHLFRQTPGARLAAYCRGRYRWAGSVCYYQGRKVRDIPGVLAVFAERRQDRHGPYAVLRCVTLR
ncbi:DUF987 family protein [Lelliottia wanjuensis]|uniref:DUF987 family protein n=1 Tax=Lelliottia wanjuensis TaxID=3050585 RepID=A0AAP4LCD7_9ENTR|nr:MULTISPECIES: DUF987 family protein [unclassified Lelliottia]MDK9365461.1 DUF987 family protein [Lelliottia sp. V106_12]MDK9587272.1 DUF987 family protein [Lelliottia sp. V86_10]MDK9615379.1 DUF987 family protein [Lelliottia sp. V106_9]